MDLPHPCGRDRVHLRAEAAPEGLSAIASAVIGPATRDDVRAILDLLADDALGASPEAAGHGDLGPYLEAFDDIAGGAGGLFVARLGERVVGTFQLFVQRQLAHRGGRVAVIESVHVASDMRGRGIGETMMRYAIEESQRRGCHRVQLTSNKRRVDAHRFYARLGFVPSHEGFKLPLGR
ncbi:MAG TPA: GNAT family N-acetyltransferase [Polyangiaceae bacterium]